MATRHQHAATSRRENKHKPSGYSKRLLGAKRPLGAPRLSRLSRLSRLALLLPLVSCALVSAQAQASCTAHQAWPEIKAAARGAEVYWHAWGGDPRINAYIAWVAAELRQDYGITLKQVKLHDTAEAVAQIIAEKASGRDSKGAVDLIWINGENFAALKRRGLLHGPFTDKLPAMCAVDQENNPGILYDFTIPVEGSEAPWGRAQLTFIADSARVPELPESLSALHAWLQTHRGRFTYPAPPDFVGSTFLKQILIGVTPDPKLLSQPAPEGAAFARATAPLWSFLEEIHPILWRKGKEFPRSSSHQRQLLNDGALDMTLTFYPLELSSAIAHGLLPETAVSFMFKEGTIGNTHFVAIPYNSAVKAASMVAANFLLSPKAQAKKQDPQVWGDLSVLDLNALRPEERAAFTQHTAKRPRAPALLEPHPSWTTRLEEQWRARFAR